ncbi:hypothetical protein [uncultured Photobacterium sp.]|uniref:hypothetical protein n=1 Tax=uncultured Photobacterium sp. TaxID=173973 RepID=UPI002602CE2F|nr:hypothetical protein [uncultured Photobacterium sp.]
MKNIYFWDYKAVAKRLYNGDFTETDSLRQFVALMIISGISIPVPFSFYIISVNKPIALDVFSFILSGVIAYVGYWWVYQSHVKNEGSEFFLKLAALELPIGFRVAVFVILPFMLLSIPLLQVITSQLLAQGLGLVMGIVAAIVHFRLLKSAICYSEN